MIDDLVGDLERLLLVVGHEDGGQADLVVELAQPAAELLADLGIERAERPRRAAAPWARPRARASAMRWRWPPES